MVNGYRNCQGASRTRHPTISGDLPHGKIALGRNWHLHRFDPNVNKKAEVAAGLRPEFSHKPHRNVPVVSTRGLMKQVNSRKLKELKEEKDKCGLACA